MAEKRTESARQESADSVEVDDLENIATPEMIMLSAVSGEQDLNPIWIVPVRQGTVLGKNACSLLSSDPEEPQKFVNS